MAGPDTPGYAWALPLLCVCPGIGLLAFDTQTKSQLLALRINGRLKQQIYAMLCSTRTLEKNVRISQPVKTSSAGPVVTTSAGSSAARCACGAALLTFRAGVPVVGVFVIGHLYAGEAEPPAPGLQSLGNGLVPVPLQVVVVACKGHTVKEALA